MEKTVEKNRRLFPNSLSASSLISLASVVVLVWLNGPFPGPFRHSEPTEKAPAFQGLKSFDFAKMTHKKSDHGACRGRFRDLKS
jgi:hypothetical protein